ncbi:hypothetical protein LC048_24560 [Mesobacillus subterraneus]|nr:hypothetical protein [Mesobacillus subterraneus]WLR55396.1 hypothetical protein LC048_24560 [Mesobacillus subterraneus]
MSTEYQWLTPEAKQQRKRRKQIIMYGTFILLSVLLSAIVTIATNQL